MISNLCLALSVVFFVVWVVFRLDLELSARNPWVLWFSGFGSALLLALSLRKVRPTKPKKK